MKPRSAVCSASASCRGVRPAAGTSLTNGTVTRPSGRTRVRPETLSWLKTRTITASPGTRTYSPVPAVAGSCTASTQTYGPRSAQPAARRRPTTTLRNGSMELLDSYTTPESRVKRLECPRPAPGKRRARRGPRQSSLSRAVGAAYSATDAQRQPCTGEWAPAGPRRGPRRGHPARDGHPLRGRRDCVYAPAGTGREGRGVRLARRGPVLRPV